VPLVTTIPAPLATCSSPWVVWGAEAGLVRPPPRPHSSRRPAWDLVGVVAALTPRCRRLPQPARVHCFARPVSLSRGGDA